MIGHLLSQIKDNTVIGVVFSYGVFICSFSFGLQ